MAKDEKHKKSTHLQELEESFDRHVRRFSPFAILGLRPEDHSADEALPSERWCGWHPPTCATHTHG